jgi:hypothetical protein
MAMTTSSHVRVVNPIFELNTGRTYYVSGKTEMTGFVVGERSEVPPAKRVAWAVAAQNFALPVYPKRGWR